MLVLLDRHGRGDPPQLFVGEKLGRIVLEGDVPLPEGHGEGEGQTEHGLLEGGGKEDLPHFHDAEPVGLHADGFHVPLRALQGFFRFPNQIDGGVAVPAGGVELRVGQQDLPPFSEVAGEGFPGIFPGAHGLEPPVLSLEEGAGRLCAPGGELRRKHSRQCGFSGLQGLDPRVVVEHLLESRALEPSHGHGVGELFASQAKDGGAPGGGPDGAAGSG